MSSIFSRLKEYIDSLKISNNEFGRSIECSSAQITQMLTYEKNFGIDKLLKIFSAYPKLNPDWLLTGNDSMLRDSKNSEETTVGVIPNATPISPAEESIIYKMYKDEKEEKERMLKEKDTENKHLQSELRAMEKELATYKAQSHFQNKESDHQSKISKVIETFTSESSGDYQGDYSPTSPPAISKKLSAGKI